MNARRILLQVMLVSLGIAAVCGVMAVLMSSGDVLWRITTMAGLTSVAALLLWPMFRMLEKAKSREAGILGIVFVGLIYLILLTVTWDVLSGSEEELLMTALVLAVIAPPAMFFLKLARIHYARVAGIFCAVICLPVMLTWMCAIWGPRPPSGRDSWWATGWILAGFGVLIGASLVGVVRGDRRFWRWIGPPAAIAASILAIRGVWSIEPEFEKTFAVLLAVSVVIAHANLASIVPLKTGQLWLRLATIACVMATAGLLVLLLFVGSRMDDLVERLAGASGILASCGSLALLVLAAINRKVQYEPTEGGLIDITIICPRCRKKQSLPIGDARCSGCDLRIHTRVEEPRCAECGYLLYRLTSDSCPECGASIHSGAV